MIQRLRRALPVVCLAIGSLLMYGARLDEPLHADEAALGFQARLIAATGRDSDGRLLPLFFDTHGDGWIAPLPVYATAIVLKARSFSEGALRTPGVLLAVIDILLMYAIARRLFDSRGLALLAGALLMATPSHFTLGRRAADALYPVTCLLLWLVTLMSFLEDPRARRLYVASLWLGVGFYSQPAATLLMPLYLGLTLCVAYWIGSDRRSHLAALAGFLTPLVLLIPWFARYPDTFAHTLDVWGLHLGHPLGSVRDALGWHALARRGALYWDYFSPSYLFFPVRGPSVFVAATAVFATAGVHWIAASAWLLPRWRVIAAGALMAPIAATAFDHPRLAALAASLAPFWVLIAAAGARRLLMSATAAARIGGIAALCAVALQFARFYVASR